MTHQFRPERLRRLRGQQVRARRRWKKLALSTVQTSWSHENKKHLQQEVLFLFLFFVAQIFFIYYHKNMELNSVILFKRDLQRMFYFEKWTLFWVSLPVRGGASVITMKLLRGIRTRNDNFLGKKKKSSRVPQSLWTLVSGDGVIPQFGHYVESSQ